MEDVAITELEKIEADRIDGVGMPANGIPVLLLKSVAKAPIDEDGSTDGPTHGAWTGRHAHPHTGSDGQMHEEEHSHDGDGDHGTHDHAGKSAFDREAAKALVKAIVGRKVDETPDIAGGTAVLSQIADLIIAEAQELKSGQAGEIADIQQLACAAEMIWCWRTGEEAVGSGSVMPATALMQSAMKGTFATVDAVFSNPEVARCVYEELIAKAKHDAADRKKLAEQGNALSDGSYPIADEEDLKSAAILAQSGHGDVEGAKRLIGRRAKELGVKNPLEGGKDDTSKSTVAEGEGTVDTETQETGSRIAKAVEDAVTKATAPLKERIESLGAELAKVKALPVPGGPVLSRNVQVKQAGAVVQEDWAAKAAYYRDMAEQVTDRGTADGYRKLAREADAKAVTPAG